MIRAMFPTIPREGIVAHMQALVNQAAHDSLAASTAATERDIARAATRNVERERDQLRAQLALLQQEN